MADNDIFRDLSFGLKFDIKRFPEDAKRLRLLKNNAYVDKKSVKELNFFEKKKEVEDSDGSIAEQSEENAKKALVKCIDDKDMPALRKKYKIFVEGADIPDLLLSFDQLQSVFQLNPLLLEVIKDCMKFDLPTPIQMQAITAMIHRRELLACAPTGSGKTLAFLIPLIAHISGKSVTEESLTQKKRNRGIKGLVVSPTRELATQTLQVCKQLVTPTPKPGVDSAPDPLLRVQVLDKAAVKRFQSLGAQHGRKYDILISTPNRLVYLLQQDPPLISLENVEWLVVDESDKLFEEGIHNGFREQLGTIYSACSSPYIRRAMFSATFAFDVQQWCHLNMDSVIQINVGGKNTAVKSVDQKLLFTGNESGKLIALRDIFRQGFKPPALVFVQSKERAKELFAELIYDGMNVDAIHADRTPLQRENAVKCFRTGTTWILICTELLGRGIDFKGVNLVINYDFPTSAVSYIHRIGRTGRAGRNGEAITFFTEEDRPLLRSVANVIKEAGCPVPDYLVGLKKMGQSDRKKAAKTEIKRPTIRSTPKDILEAGRKRKNETEPKNKKLKNAKKPVVSESRTVADGEKVIISK